MVLRGKAGLGVLLVVVLPACSLITDFSGDDEVGNEQAAGTTSKVVGGSNTTRGSSSATNFTKRDNGGSPATSSGDIVTAISAGGTHTTTTTGIGNSRESRASGGDSGGGSTSIGGSPSETDSGVPATGGSAPTTSSGTPGGTAPTGGTTPIGMTETGGTTATGGMTATGGTTSSATCTDEGCACSGTVGISCNDCGTRLCNSSTHRWGPCSSPQNPAATRCANSTALQTCSSDGKWVSSTCATSDATNCTVSCVAGGTNSTCKIVAKDSDADLHGTTGCAAAPGDDCDDSNNAIYPGASETCDGVDNNCNSKADLQDGLVLSGTPRLRMGYPDTVLAWSPTQHRFAMVSHRNSDSMLYFGAMSVAGASTWNSTSIDPLMTNQYNTAKQILWVPTRSTFAFAYAAGGRGTYSGHFVYDLTDQGVPSGGYPIGDYPSLGLRGSGDVLIVHGKSDGMHVSRYYGSGLDAGTLLSESSLYQRIAISGSQAAIIYRNSSTETIRWVTVTSLVEGTAIHLDLVGQYPDIAAVLPGFAVAWAVASGLRYQVLTTDGAQLCAINIAFGNGTLDHSDAVAIASTEHGTLVLVTDSGGTEARLFRIDTSCNVMDSVPVSSISEATSAPAIAVGGGYVALAWQKYQTTSPADSYVRIVGDRLCN